jgi:hypothetical protein
VPIALLLLVVLELNGASGAWLHALGLSLLVCRVVHPLGLRFDDSKVPARFLGAFGTLLVVLVEIGLAGWQARLG